MAASQHTAPNPFDAKELLSPLEAPLAELEIRLGFLVDHFEHTDAEMSPEALHLFLQDCLEAVEGARKLWRASWEGACGVEPEAAGPADLAPAPSSGVAVPIGRRPIAFAADMVMPPEDLSAMDRYLYRFVLREEFAGAAADEALAVVCARALARVRADIARRQSEG